MIQLQRLEGFYRVARAEGYARAVRSFPYPITQPGIHQQVKRLESEVGVALFERVGKDRVVLTPEGRALYSHVAPFLEGLDAVVQSLRKGEVGGTLRIHASGHVLRHLLPAWLRRLQARRPDIEVVLHESKVPAVDILSAGDTDLVVDHLPEVPEDVEARVVGHTAPFLVLPSNHPQAKSRRVRLDLLRDDAFIAYSTDKYLRELQLAELARAGVRPRRLHAADSSETILGFVSAGLGYSLLASLLPGGPREAGVVARPLPGAPSGAIQAAWRRSSARSPLIQAALTLAPKP
ncbi:LysR family transcriptional regulator [Myxococcus sp. MISCRS1]|jgi:DNA-binding transcriptional LysR family regulator|uniref:LysR family transcriptional regulator n=1 Tax=Myxococcus TaxID=32 RepID=UPI001CBBA7E9|nr:MULTISPECIES: LysR family transcriptional regulator [unclassified Myxococcus]MBZ4395475.1 LysR family transcriptional regulator [Myxococcus sp. AS-1-15]MCY0999172.1 LysR family transcriptional regulator [Myxococcus sp. MISCRS1]BDT30825.1 LysR family transcriptional regulator [Myxococcus sp. MH1]